PILYAMAYPERLATGGDRLDLAKIGQLTFEAPDARKFPGLSLAYEALAAGGTACAMLNAANEVAVEAFLGGRVPFGRIVRVVRETLERVPAGSLGSLEDVLAADGEARRMASSLLS
ncbi:MAG: 1-deoxy-D-xylulose-5-phosphate reductoisomerase, partial [Firmicutes bacterium]|nr:1-deoxy-D-xylulose-5-phosphate reductoisomerase [Bacillota bacterium]